MPVTGEHLEIGLKRGIEISGVIVDADSRSPLSRVNVSLLPITGNNSITSYGLNNNGVTTADGGFKISDISGDYVLRVGAGQNPKIVPIPLEQAKSEDAQAKRESSDTRGFTPNMYWPGSGTKVESSFHVAGLTMNLGEVRLEKVRLRKLAGWIDADCQDDDIVEVILGRGRGDRFASGEIPCHSGFEIQNLPDGDFSISSMVIGGGIRQIGSQSIDERTHGPIVLTLRETCFVNDNVRGRRGFDESRNFQSR